MKSVEAERRKIQDDILKLPQIGCDDERVFGVKPTLFDPGDLLKLFNCRWGYCKGNVDLVY